ncbi:MAG: (d)CMP kinase [Pseudolysinimonas sp.]|uniref:(d)CMP kinase n=1 Tax=Pseudolysinimonas sp. TaxID=2680009 RepID=UPI0032660645
MSTIVVAIDGPAGSGKSSVSRAAASRLGFDFLDTGAAYRALTWLTLERGLSPADADAVIAVVDDLDYATVAGEHDTVVLVRGTDVSHAIREPRITAVVSDVARIPEVRVRLNEMFRATMAATSAPGVVTEGRDITTVVAPDAHVRILLTADEDVRIARRARELAPEAANTASQLRERDKRDATVVDFLTAAPGVTTLDSTNLDFEQTVQAVLDLVNSARAVSAAQASEVAPT